MSEELNEENLIIVKKGDVLHKFIPFDMWTDRFVRYRFNDWEPETFEVFEKVKDPVGVAVDLGAWIGTTAIWLSKHFKRVIAVEADKKSLVCLEQNLKASDCLNVCICYRPIAKEKRVVIFGPRDSRLNESTSSIQDKIRNENDYFVESLSFNDLVNEYRRSKEGISFIKCDIEGGEEEIFEDILVFALKERCKVYISFHLEWWKNKDLTRFTPLFAQFHTNLCDENIINYIEKNPFESLLFIPR